MSPHRKARAATSVAALLALGSLLAGCSGSDGSPKQAPPVKSSPVRTPQVTTPPVRTTSAYTASRKGSGVPTDQEMRLTADRLRKRATALGIRDTQVRVDGRVITIVSPAGSADRLRKMTAPGVLEFRPVLDPAAAGRNGLQKAYGSLACDHAATPAPPRPGSPAVGCDRQSGQKYLLGPTAIGGTDVRSATAAFDRVSGSGWVVDLSFGPAGSSKFTKVTGTLAQLTPPANQFAIVVDGEVLSAPSVVSAITGGKARISGAFTQDAAQDLAAAISSGALPLQLTVGDVSTTS
ncbi:hypothetical protein [Streptomyces sp. NPDC049040]|uniref:SecDF P1 head subdomain-containing protein n=1 Tax=Streptomyces sp. NPDC049040 TaxID=3365593 RepID=UPI00371F0645